MGEVIVFASVSVDGFSAEPGRRLDRLHRWMYNFEQNTQRGFEDEFITAFNNAGAIVIGRHTFDDGQDPWGEEDVFHAPVVVATHETRSPLTKNGTTFTFVNGSAQEILSVATELAGDKSVVVMGSADVSQQFLRAGVVDVILLHEVPVLLGAGTPLFAELPEPVELVPTLMSMGQEVSMQAYRVERSSQ